jgi:putative transposase
MARLQRLSLGGVAHLLLLRGHNGGPVFHDDEDRSSFLAALQSAFDRESIALHAYALPVDRVWLLCTPQDNRSLSRAVQALGRRFVAAFNRRHGRSGSLWDGRYRSTVVEPGPTLLDAMVFVDTAGVERSVDFEVAPTAWSSARQHLGFDGPALLKDTAEYWALGNTPFDRAAAYRSLLAEGTPQERTEHIAAATHRGWALGSAAFVEALQRRTDRPLRPRPRGRPNRSQHKSKQPLL